MATDSPVHKSSRKRKAGKIFLAVVILIVVIRLILPYIVLHFANKSLAGMNGYYGLIGYLGHRDSGYGVRNPVAGFVGRCYLLVG